MDVQLARNLIIERLFKVNDEKLLKSIFQLIGIDEKEADNEFIKSYEAKLKPMTKEELIKRSEKSLQSFREGKFIEIEKYLEEIKDIAVK